MADDPVTDALHSAETALQSAEAAETAKAAAPGAAVAAVVDAWFASLNGGPLAQTTDAYNQVHAALPELKAQLAALSAS